MCWQADINYPKIASGVYQIFWHPQRAASGQLVSWTLCIFLFFLLTSLTNLNFTRNKALNLICLKTKNVSLNYNSFGQGNYILMFIALSINPQQACHMFSACHDKFSSFNLVLLNCQPDNFLQDINSMILNSLSFITVNYSTDIIFKSKQITTSISFR